MRLDFKYIITVFASNQYFYPHFQCTNKYWNCPGKYAALQSEIFSENLKLQETSVLENCESKNQFIQPSTMPQAHKLTPNLPEIGWFSPSYNPFCWSKIDFPTSTQVFVYFLNIAHCPISNIYRINILLCV